MREIPEFFRRHLTDTLLGRLKLNLFKKITDSTDLLPDAQQVRLFLLDEFRSNSEAATLFGALLNLNHSKTIAYDLLPDLPRITDVLRALEVSPLEEPFFLELNNCPEPWPSTLGILVYWEELADGGYVYIVTLLNTDFPEDGVGRAEIRASQIAPEPAFSMLGADGYKTVSQHDYRQNATAVLLARTLTYIEQNRFKSLIPFDEARTTSLTARKDLKPPPDPRFKAILNLVMRGSTQCVEAQIDTSLVKPHALDFALTYPLEVVNQSADMIQRGLANRLLVYWNNGVFVMSDSYPIYLAYRKLGYKQLPAVIMGPFLEGTAIVEHVGGIELIPPLVVANSNDYGALSPELKDFLLDNRLREKPASEAVLKLYGLFIELFSLVNDPHTKERQLHNLLLQNPIALDAFGLRVRTEVKLGDDYRIDLVIQYEFTDRRTLLIELERANIPILTQKGRLRSDVVHAIQQVEDWLRWWRENPVNVPAGLDGTIAVEGLVVIGRSANMSEDDKRRLLSLNQTRLVQVITYDDLLDRIKNLIINLENSASTN